MSNYIINVEGIRMMENTKQEPRVPGTLRPATFKSWPLGQRAKEKSGKRLVMSESKELELGWSCDCISATLPEQ